MIRDQLPHKRTRTQQPDTVPPKAPKNKAPKTPKTKPTPTPKKKAAPVLPAPPPIEETKPDETE